MPSEFDPKPVLESASFNLTENQHKSAQQAILTYMMRAKENAVLGNGGETLAFAKPKYDGRDAGPLDQTMVSAGNEMRQKRQENPLVREWEEAAAMAQTIEDTGALLEETKTKLAAVNARQNPPAELVADLTDKIGKMESSLAEWGPKEPYETRRDELANLPDVIRQGELKATAADMKEKLKPVLEITSTSGPLFDAARPDDLMAEVPPSYAETPSMGADRGLLARSIASYQVDKLLGAGIIAEEKLGVAEDGKLLGVSVQVDGAQVVGPYQDKTAYLTADYSDPRIQKGMADLEAMDYITGQIDRHNGNIFVDPSNGKVSGIDNDLAFPEVEREDMLQRNEVLQGKAVAGMPKQMSQETAQKILALSPERLGQELQNLPLPEGVSPLSPAAIDGAKKRLVDLQAAIKNPNSGMQIVAQFDEGTYAAAVKAQMDNVKAMKQKPQFADAKVEDSPANDFSNVDDGNLLLNTPKASYLWSALLQGRLAEVNLDQDLELGTSEFSMRDPETAGKARVNPEFASYKQLEQEAIKTMAAAPNTIADVGVRKEVTKIQKEIDSLKAKLADYPKQIEKLDHANLAERAKAKVMHGGISGAKDHLRDKQQGVMQEIKAAEEKLAAQMDLAVDPMRADLKKLAGTKVAAQQQQQAPPPVADIEVDNEENLANELQANNEVSVNSNVPANKADEIVEEVDAQSEVLKEEFEDKELDIQDVAELSQEEKQGVEGENLDAVKVDEIKNEEKQDLEEESVAEQQVGEIQNDQQEQKEEQKQEQPEPDINLEHHQKAGSVGQFLQARKSPGIQKLMEMGVKPPPLPPGVEQGGPKQDGEKPGHKPNLRAQFQRQNADPAAIGAHRAQNMKKGG